MADTALYLGRPGDVRRIYDPTGGMMATREIDSSVFTTGQGGARVAKMINGTRQYQLNYAALGRVNWEYLNTLHQGGYGTGPFILLDPGRRNLLTGNQSSGTSLIGDAREFTVSGAGGSIASVASTTSGFPKVLQWSFATTTPASALLTLNKPSSVWPGIPVIVRPYTFWCLVLGVTGSITLALQIQWLDVNGGAISTSTSTATASSLTGFTLYSLTATPPATAVYAVCSVLPTVATITSGESLLFSSLMFQEGSAKDTAWQMGSGVFPVVPLALPEVYGFAEPNMLVSPQLTLQEVK